MEKQKESIPSNLAEALDFLLENSSKKDQQTLCFSPSSAFHFTSGMGMRNNWGLWDKKSELNKWFSTQGIYHADDMSAIIIESFRRLLLEEEIDLAGQVKYYQDFWANEMKDVVIDKGNYKIIVKRN